ncbi:MAG: D-alanyl-D-alanine carboxypeptidase [Pseudomonas sp.]|uniref:D-alanyl-D-alanine carboxypeptidase family protein n=1 Tax=Pseudomonas abieticivorans TaxID=2931382 RepID=UPI0020C083CB|nr:D-alanyl-D-alanine carboxypeptidase family protein [Pseudomonas sp. PIA16]MDE1165529.1 D-alanyl-D-alanine carboxypeptidase [Pseudomonas sp.]
MPTLTPTVNTASVMVPQAPQLSAKAWVLMDADSGAIISSQDPDERLPPASLTKLMTVYIATRDIQAGRLKPTDMVDVSSNAWSTGGSRMFLAEHSRVSVDDLLHGIIIDSGNDSAVALAEHIAGSEDAFAQMMNAMAQKLGLANSHFMNPTGLPVDDHYSSAHDMALLARAIIHDEAGYYPLYANKYFTWNNIRQPNRNLLLWRDPTVDGLKTGHTEAAGYCMVSSALRDHQRLIATVFGSNSIENRSEDSQKLLTYGFRFFETHTYEQGGKVLANAPLWKGAKDTLAVGLLDNLTLTLPRKSNRNVQPRATFNSPLQAPIAAGSVVGTYDLYDGDQKIASRPLVALEDGKEGGLFTRLFDDVRMFFHNLFGG